MTDVSRVLANGLLFGAVLATLFQSTSGAISLRSFFVGQCSFGLAVSMLWRPWV